MILLNSGFTSCTTKLQQETSCQIQSVSRRFLVHSEAKDFFITSTQSETISPKNKIASLLLAHVTAVKYVACVIAVLRFWHFFLRRGAVACLGPSHHGGGRDKAIKTGLLDCLWQPLYQWGAEPACISGGCFEESLLAPPHIPLPRIYSDWCQSLGSVTQILWSPGW